MASFVLKQNVGGASGHGLPAIDYRQERAPTPERRFSSQGKIERFCESTKFDRRYIVKLTREYEEITVAYMLCAVFDLSAEKNAGK